MGKILFYQMMIRRAEPDPPFLLTVIIGAPLFIMSLLFYGSLVVMIGISFLLTTTIGSFSLYAFSEALFSLLFPLKLIYY